MSKTKTFLVEIELTDAQIKAINKRLAVEMSDAEKIAGLAASALEDLADGGIVLSGAIMRQITAVAGAVENTQQLVSLVEQGQSMNSGRKGYTWYPDPTYTPVLEENASVQGSTVDQLVQDFMDYGVGQGWGYALSPDVSTVFFSKADMEYLRKDIGKPQITGTDIAEWVRGRGVAASKR